MAYRYKHGREAPESAATQMGPARATGSNPEGPSGVQGPPHPMDGMTDRQLVKGMQKAMARGEDARSFRDALARRGHEVRVNVRDGGVRLRDRALQAGGVLGRAGLKLAGAALKAGWAGARLGGRAAAGAARVAGGTLRGMHNGLAESAGAPARVGKPGGIGGKIAYHLARLAARAAAGTVRAGAGMVGGAARGVRDAVRERRAKK